MKKLTNRYVERVYQKDGSYFSTLYDRESKTITIHKESVGTSSEQVIYHESEIDAVRLLIIKEISSGAKLFSFRDAGELTMVKYTIYGDNRTKEYVHVWNDEFLGMTKVTTVGPAIKNKTTVEINNGLSSVEAFNENINKVYPEEDCSSKEETYSEILICQPTKNEISQVSIAAKYPDCLLEEKDEIVETFHEELGTASRNYKKIMGIN